MMPSITYTNVKFKMEIGGNEKVGFLSRGLGMRNFFRVFVSLLH